MKKKLCVFILSAVLCILYINGSVAAVSNTVVAMKSSGKILIDGGEAIFDAYNINGNNYFKLRDIAYKLSGTDAQFEVDWDGVKNALSLFSGKPYTPVGGEMTINEDTAVQTVKLSGSKVILDGKEVKLTAYLINGNNYFKLRDIAEAFDFFVGWNAKTSTVVIDTAKKYIPELTEAEVYNKMIALKNQYPHGMEWKNDKYYIWKGGIYRGGYGCLAFAFILSDEAFGSLPARKHTDLNNIKIGDILRINNDTHSVVLIAKDDKKVTVAEGNFNDEVYWEREFTWQELKAIFDYAITRYLE